MLRNKSLWLAAATTALVLSSVASSWLPSSRSSGAATSPVVVRLYVEDNEHLNAVAGELDIWEAHVDDGYVVAAVTLDQYRWLEGMRYLLEIDSERTALLNVQAPLDPRFYYFDDHYPNANGRYIVDFLEKTNATFPTLTELTDIGDAWLASQPGEYDRDVWVLRVTNEDPAFGPIEDKPAFFLMAASHPREVAVPELAIRYVKFLTEGYGGDGGYGTDADVTWLLDHNVAYILVMQNPDGYAVNEQDTGVSRRKNMDWDDGCSSPSSWGVDLNRNHSFLWGCCGGSSNAPCSSNYRGPGRASEPETQAFQSYFATVMVDQNGPNGDDEIAPAAADDTTGIFVTLHSYGDLVLWPWGFSGHGLSANYAQLRTIGRKFAYYSGYAPSGSIWYAVDGAADDWTYGKFGIASYTFEIGPESGSCSGFLVRYDCLDGYGGRDFWAENRQTLLYAHKIARTPYITAYGPDVGNAVAIPSWMTPGTSVALTATIADQRYGADPLQPIAAAEYFLDAPGSDGTGFPMLPSDGSWSSTSEDVEAVVDTTGLPLGQHYLLVHGQNDSGDWGPFSGVFLRVSGPATLIHLPLVMHDFDS